MSWFTPSKDKISQISDLMAKDEVIEKSITKVISYDDTEISKYMPINIMDFFDPCFANVRPRKLTISATNLNTSIIKEATLSYIHTPLNVKDLEGLKTCNLNVQQRFEKETVYDVNTPYLTYCQTDEENNIIDTDISQITNVNLTASRAPFVSMGAIVMALNRNTTGQCSVEVTFKISYTIKPY